MRAAVLNGIRSLTLDERPEPALSAHDVRVRVDLVGLCGSDLSYFARGANGDFAVQEPLVLGHEIIGTVTERGALADAEIRVGDRVAVHPAWPSPRSGASTIDADLASEPSSFLGSASTSPHTDGGLQEQLVLRPERLRRVPESLDSRTAVLAEPMAVVLHALANAGDAIRGADVTVCGAGAIGLLSIVAIRQAGAASITVTDVRAEALALAQRLGADQTVDVSVDRASEASASVVVEASGVPASLEAAVRIARTGGVIIQLGMLPREARPMTLSGLVVKALTLAGSHRFGGELDAALVALERAPECAEIVTAVVPLTSAADAFAAVADPTIAGKVVVDVSGMLTR